MHTTVAYLSVWLSKHQSNIKKLGAELVISVLNGRQRLYVGKASLMEVTVDGWQLWIVNKAGAR
jgi:hypothetical protein